MVTSIPASEAVALALQVAAGLEHRPHGLDGHLGVPLHGRRDHHGIDVVAGQHLAEVTIDAAAFERAGRALRRVVRLDRLLDRAAVLVDVRAVRELAVRDMLGKLDEMKLIFVGRHDGQ